MENNEQELRYLVPANVAARFEFIPGFGWVELLWTLVATAISGAIFLFVGLFPFSKLPVVMLVRVFVLILIPGFVFATFKPIDSSGISIAKRRRDIKKFRASQKRYLYISEK